ncbi:MAG: hypothetical protein ABSC23_07730 [Bryobacteraceae bacterium]|jgi:hypothetical protein
MAAQTTPFRWPDAWKDPARLALLSETCIDCVVMAPDASLDAVAARAKQNGLTVIDPAAPPSDVVISSGVWPGVQSGQGPAAASAGPTGNPWVDSNGWLVRLERARHPDSRVWIDAQPKGPRLLPSTYVLAVTDAAACGGRWIVSLDGQLAGDLAQSKPEALATWKRVTGAARFFADHADWTQLAPAAVVGIVSDFAGDDEFMGRELLNLVSRTNQQYRIILKDRAVSGSFTGLRGVIYADLAPPGPALRDRVLAYVQSGGMLITGPNWGAAPGAPARNQLHPRYGLRTLGRGSVAFAKEDLSDPYQVANDSAVLISHRYDLVQFWNGGAVESYYTASPDKRRAVVHMMFFADRGPASVSVRVAGSFRTGKLWTLDGVGPRAIEMEHDKEAVELHLPFVSQYAAAELEG